MIALVNGIPRIVREPLTREQYDEENQPDPENPVQREENETSKLSEGGSNTAVL